MKKTFKGFTLVECLVAMAILSIACMALGAIEASVAQKNNANNFMNTSLANQMAYVERYEQTDTVKIASTHTGDAPPSGTNSGTSSYVKVTNTITNEAYSFPVDIYVMYSRDNSGKSSQDSDYGSIASQLSKEEGLYVDGSGNVIKNDDGESQGNLRYKYILGHHPTS